MKRLVVVSTLVLLCLQVASASASHYLGVHWPRWDPRTITVRDHTPDWADWPVFVNDAHYAWTGHSNVSLGYLNADESTDYCGEYAMQNYTWLNDEVQACADWTPYDPNADICGLATWYADAYGHLARASAVVKTDPACTLNNPNAVRVYWCHELGHTIGLAHRLSYDSCMRGSPYGGPNIGVGADDHDRGQSQWIYAEREDTYNHWATVHATPGVQACACSAPIEGLVAPPARVTPATLERALIVPRSKKPAFTLKVKKAKKTVNVPIYAFSEAVPAPLPGVLGRVFRKAAG